MKEQPSNLLSEPHLGVRYNRGPRTINTWKRKKILPAPDVTINGRDYWYEETIEQNEREQLSAKRYQGDEAVA